MYLHTPEVFSASSPYVRMLAGLLANIKASFTHFIVAGDFNQDPSVVAPLLADLGDIQVVAPAENTYYSTSGCSRIDWSLLPSV